MNYRPVPLTSIFCKLIEHIITSNIMKHLDAQGLLFSEQHGFRKCLSCETQLLLLVEELSKIVDSGKQVDVVFLNSSKAFDTVPHLRLLHKLEAYKVDRSILNWLQSFLSNRSQRVIIDGVTSNSVQVTSGVSQGSVLGPLLFLLYINDLPANIQSSIRLFVHDTVIYREINSVEDGDELQESLNYFEEWCNLCQLKLNA